MLPNTLFTWVLTLLFFPPYFQANLIVQEARLGKAMASLQEAQAQLDEKQRELDAVQAKFDAAMAEKQALLDDAESCRRKMGNATALIEGLGGEKVRWTEASKRFESQINRWDQCTYLLILTCRCSCFCNV